MRLSSDPGPGSHHDVLERRLEALRAPGDPSHPRPPEPAQPGAPGEAPELPEPGRHASRRAAARPRAVVGRTVAEVVPSPLRGSVALGGAQLAVVAVVVAVGLCLTAWWVLRADARAVEAPAPAGVVEPAADLVALEPAALEPAAEPAAPAAGGEAHDDAADVPGASAAPPTEEVTVDVAGEVRRTGVVTLPAGSRVVDALEAAGGARPGVDLAPLNLARVLVDGEQVLVGQPPPGAPVAAPAGTPAPSGAAPTPATVPVALVDLNTADLTMLETLPQVGPVTAQAIVTWREENGGFTAVEELLEVDGIGEVTLADIAPHATV